MDDRVLSRANGRLLSAVVTAVLMGGILPPAGLGQEAATAEKPAAKPWPATGNVARALARTAKLEFKDTPLQEALDRISTQYRVEIILCNRALAKEHISPDNPVTERIHGVKLDKGLGTLLKHQNLTYAVCDNAILVTTAKQAEVELITRVYPLSLPRAAGRGGNPAAVNAFLNEVQATLTQKVAPKSWDSVGGAGSSCAIWLGGTGRWSSARRGTYRRRSPRCSASVP